MRRYNLAMMLEEIRRDEQGGKPAPAKRVLTQQEIKALAKARRAQGARKPPPQ